VLLIASNACIHRLWLAAIDMRHIANLDRHVKASEDIAFIDGNGTKCAGSGKVPFNTHDFCKALRRQSCYIRRIIMPLQNTQSITNSSSRRRKPSSREFEETNTKFQRPSSPLAVPIPTPASHTEAQSRRHAFQDTPNRYVCTL